MWKITKVKMDGGHDSRGRVPTPFEIHSLALQRQMTSHNSMWLDYDIKVVVKQSPRMLWAHKMNK
jgi:hypothetical protein